MNMTREEAKAIFDKERTYFDGLVALGLLKLEDEEPEKARLKRVLISVFNEYDSLNHLRGPSSFVYMLDRAGFKIVPK